MSRRGATLVATFYPFAKGALTATGIQYSTEKVTSTDGYETVEEKTVELPQNAIIEEIEFGLTGGFRSSSTGENVLYKWLIKDHSQSSYDTLVAEQTLTTPGITSLEYSHAGRLSMPGTYFTGTEYQFDIALQVKSGSAGGETAKGKTKNSSYVRIKYHLI